MNRHRYAPHPSNSSGEKAQLVLAYQELGKELHSTQLKVIGNYTLGRVIGEGSFGTVRLGIHRLTGSRVAIKHIPKSSSPPLLTREIHHHRRLHHPNVVQLYEVIATEHSIWLITELCPGGELFDYLVEKTRFTEFEARRLFGQICLGLGYVHRQGVVHRDLKLENVLLDERCNPKLADFGFGREFEPRKLLDTFCGTTGYAAPEMLAGRKYLGEEVDIWSLGIILHALLTGSLPFDDDDEDVMKSMIMVGKFDIPSFLSIEAGDLIKSILKQDPKARLSIEKILAHPWFILPPSQHTFVESDPFPRPSPIAEEFQHLQESPEHSSFTLPSLDHLDQALSLETPKLGNSAPSSCPGTWVADPDTSESSCKDSVLDAGSGRSNTSSAHLPLTPLKASPETRPPSLPLEHQKASISAMKNVLLPPIEPCQPLYASALHQHIASTSIVGVEPTHSEDQADIYGNAPSGSSNPPLSVAKTSHPKPRPLSILAALPSSISHPAIRTPSRTKRRSVGSTMSERLGPLDDLSNHTDLATPTTNQGRLSVSSLSMIVIDYLGALKSTTQTPLLSEEDIGLLKSLGTLGFDTGQVIHSVQSNACDSSGAMWWLLKRKLDKQHQDRENLERNANRLSATASLKQQPSAEFQTTESVVMSDFVSGADVAIDDSFNPPPAPHPTMSITSPQDTPMQLPSATSRPDSKKTSTPRKPKPVMGSQKNDPLLTPVQIEHEAGAVNFCLPNHRSPSNSSGYSTKKPQPLVAISGNINDDARSSTSSAKGDTRSSSDKEGVPWIMDAAASGKKVTPERRKRSQSVSMLQRATHALAPKKSVEDKHTKIRSREGSSATEGEEKHGHEKVSRKDMKAREKEGRMLDEPTKSGSLQLSGLFSRKALVLPPIPHLPVGLMLHQSSTTHDKPDKYHGKGKELEVPKDSRASVSMPSSPSKSNEAALSPRRDSDPTYIGQGEEHGSSVKPSVPSSVSLCTDIPQGPLLVQMNHLSTPKPLSSSGTMSTSTPNSKFDDRQTMSDVSPALSSLSKIDVSGGTRASESDSLAAKSGRAKGNLFSNFRFWFNEDRRKRKRNMAVMTSYSNLSNSPSSRGNGRNNNLAGAGSPVGASSTGGSLAGRKGPGDSQSAWPVPASVEIHRQTSKSSRRSSLQSNRRLSVEHNGPKAASAMKRRSGSSRASFGSLTGSRTPTSEPGSYHSSSQHAANPSRRLSLEGRAKRPPGHLRQASTSSGGSRRSSAPMHHLAPTGPSVVHPGYMRRTSSNGTTVRRITTTTNVGQGGGRHRQAKAPSATSSVRTSMSSDEGSAAMPRGPSSSGEEHRLHSPINVYDVEETIEEEEDDEVEGGPSNDNGTEEGKAHGETNAARRSALQKLSGDEPERTQRRTNGGEAESNSSGGGTRTIFMAHKAHSVFGTPTQAFFGRAQASSPMGAKTGGGGGAAYVNLMKTIADGPGTRRGGGEPRLRDVFASKVTEDGEWVDLDDEDDVGQRYEGGIGQGVRRRSEVVGMSRDGGVEVKRPMEQAERGEAGEEAKPKGCVVGGVTQASSECANGSPGPGAALNLIGNWRGGNHRIMSSFKSAAIEEEEEEEE